MNLLLGDNIKLLKTLESNSIDSIVTDPPYGISFMNKKWDYQVPTIEFWKEVYRVLKPGGHILSFGGTRTYHRMVVNIEDAGFEIRDQIQWIYGSGFPKSLNIGKAVDKIQGNKREVIGSRSHRNSNGSITYSRIKGPIDKDRFENGVDITKGTSPFEGQGTALKPANEPICLARKPISENTIAENVLKWGTGGINIDGCRISTNEELGRNNKTNPYNNNVDNGGIWNRGSESLKPLNTIGIVDGRFPANIIFDEEAAELLDIQSGITKSSDNKWVGEDTSPIYGKYKDRRRTSTYVDKGGASRFFKNISGGTEDFFIYKENNIFIWNTKCLDISDLSTEDGIDQLEKMVKENINQSQGLYGRNIMVKYLMGAIFITKMKTHSTITFQILNVYSKTIIGNFTVMIDEKKSQSLTEKNILNVQVVSNESVLVSFINPQIELLVPIVNYVLEESLKSGEMIIENTITNTIESIGNDRFFYCAKVSKAERNMGLDGFEERKSDYIPRYSVIDGDMIRSDGSIVKPVINKNTHPTIKPINLMSYLCRLITPKGGIILDPFMGSGSTGIAAKLEGFEFIGMEMDPEYFKIAESRINNYEMYIKFIK